MGGLSLDNPLAFTFGILGNIISFMVYLAPLPTFYRVYRKRSTEGFQSIPYVVALFSAMLWIYYAFEKSDAYFLITINSVGCIIETFYIAIYLKFAPRNAKIFTAKVLFLLNVVVFGLILLLTSLLSKGSNRVLILGWICMVFSVSVFVAPLSIMRLVIRTRSVEFMPFTLSLFLTLSAVVWFWYGYLNKDKFVAVPNIIGFLFGLAQMLLYMIFKNSGKVIEEHDCPEHIVSVVRVGAAPSSEVHPIEAAIQAPSDEDHKEGEDGKVLNTGDEKEISEAKDGEIQLSHIV